MKRLTFLKTIVLAAWSTMTLSFPIDMDIVHPKVPEPEPNPEPPKPKKPEAKRRPIITLFTASWCGPCQRLKSRLKSRGLMKYVTIADCSSDANFSKYANKYKFRGVPTIVVLVDDKEVERGNSGNAEALIKKYIQ